MKRTLIEKIMTAKSVARTSNPDIFLIDGEEVVTRSLPKEMVSLLEKKLSGEKIELILGKRTIDGDLI